MLASFRFLALLVVGYVSYFRLGVLFMLAIQVSYISFDGGCDDVCLLQLKGY